MFHSKILNQYQECFSFVNQKKMQKREVEKKNWKSTNAFSSIFLSKVVKKRLCV